MTDNQVRDPQTKEPVPSSRRRSFFQGVTFTSAGTAVNIVFLFVETMLAARLLDTDSFGVYTLLTVVVGFVMVAIDFGCQTAVTQLIASSERTEQSTLASSTLLFRFVVVLIASAILLAGRRALILVDPSGAIERYALWIPVMLMVATLDELLQSILQGYQAYQRMAVAQILRSILRLLLSSSLLLVLNLGMMGLIYSWIISFLASVIYQLLVLPKPGTSWLDWGLLRKALRFGFPLQLDRFLSFTSNSIHPLLLSALTSPTIVALFNVAQRIPTAFLRLTQSYTAVYFPTATALLAEKKKRQAQQLLNHSLRLLSFLTASVALVSVLFSREIMVLLFSAKYSDSSAVFGLLMVAMHMQVMLSVMGYTLTAASYPQRSLVSNAIRETSMVLVEWILIPIFGLVGPVYAKLAAYYAVNPLAIWLLRRSEIEVMVAPYVKQVVLLWLSAALFWWLQPLGYLVRLGIITGFFVLNIALSTISSDDLLLVLPAPLTKRLGMRGRVIS